jgi:hypothetical protein
MTNLTFKDVRTLPIFRSLCKNPPALMPWAICIFYVHDNVHLVLYKSRRAGWDHPPKCRPELSYPFILQPLFWEYPTMCLYLTQSVQSHPAWQPSSSKKRKSIRIEGPGNNSQITCSFQSWHEIAPTHPLTSLWIAANTTPFAAKCPVFLLTTNDPQTVPHPTTVQHRIAVASGRPS